MAKQSFVTGQVLTASQMTSLQQTAMLGGAASAKVASYILVATDAGDAITMSNAGATTITANTGLFAAGDTVTIINLGAGACTITAGTATLTTSGSLVLATNQGGVLRFTSASAAIFFQFATPASGDIEGVTAGTGISGGGTSGTVTITNSMATAIDAKGDLIAGTGADTFDRLAVGADGTTLVADSSEATGLKWATPAGGGGGLVKITALNPSAASEVIADSVFSSTYDSYLIVGHLTQSEASNVRAQLRSDGSNLTTSTYITTYISTSTAYDGWYLKDGNGTLSNFSITLSRPNLAARKQAVFQISVNGQTGFNSNLQETTDTARTGIRFFPDSGTFTGQIVIYGLEK